MPKATTSIIVTHEVGLHARPASKFVKLASNFPCNVTVRNLSSEPDEVANAKSLLSILTLGVHQNHEIEIVAEGEDVDKAIAALTALIENNFGEE